MLDVEKSVLTALQRGVEPVSRPFANLDLPETDVVSLLKRSKDEGLLRRFGGVFDSRRLGYRSILCALDVADDLLAEKAALISALPGVTHCYERIPYRGEGAYPKLWFTLAALRDQYDQVLDCLREELAPGLLYELPSLQRFKIDVVFNLHAEKPARPLVKSAPRGLDDESYREFSEDEKSLVRALDQQIPLVAQPFAAVAEQIGQSEEFVLSSLKNWKEQGALRRIGAILYHRQAGFNANAMCVWPVVGDMADAGRRVAARPEVTHCYQRPRFNRFPYDLYAMIHTASWEETEALYKDISVTCGLSGGELFASGREFKKSSMMYFR